MSEPDYGHDFWERLWSKTLRDHADKVARRPPNALLMERAQPLQPGRALDAGCGHGAESLWLAARGWSVTAVDFSAAALDHGRATAQALGEPVASRIDWVRGDLTRWAPEPERYALVVCLYVHIPDDPEAMVRRLAGGVEPGGVLLMTGHQPIDPQTGSATAAAGQTQVSVDAARAALDPALWDITLAEERPRRWGGGVDAVICARRVGTA